MGTYACYSVTDTATPYSPSGLLRVAAAVAAASEMAAAVAAVVAAAVAAASSATASRPLPYRTTKGIRIAYTRNRWRFATRDAPSPAISLSVVDRCEREKPCN